MPHCFAQGGWHMPLAVEENCPEMRLLRLSKPEITARTKRLSALFPRSALMLCRYHATSKPESGLPQLNNRNLLLGSRLCRTGRPYVYISSPLTWCCVTKMLLEAQGQGQSSISWRQIGSRLRRNRR